MKLLYIKGDLFSAPLDYSLAHCVSNDFQMRDEIAKLFNKKFQHKSYLQTLSYNNNIGNTIALIDSNSSRFIYYLVTQKYYYNKPTLLTLELTLKKMRNHMIYNNIKNLAIPQLGCGLDQLYWDDVVLLLNNVFNNVDANLYIYVL